MKSTNVFIRQVTDHHHITNIYFIKVELNPTQVIKRIKRFV
jgi:hypothetical protein